MYSLQTKFLIGCIACCWFLSSISARIAKPSHGVPTYEPYQMQQHGYEDTHTQSAPAQVYHQPIAAPTPQYNKHYEYAAHKPSIGNYHSDSGHKTEENHDDYHTHPKYKYSYHVEEHKTGDFKRLSEERDGDVVHGEYSMIEADGGLRTIKYTVDKEHGFQATVSKTAGKMSKE